MSQTDRKSASSTSSSPKSGSEDRQARLASALRANLKKRKAQVRSRKANEDDAQNKEE
ncbi:hypothetical protein [Fodinicurvata sediminis]|uniref:hypothetical protein n=1 Tax=Fodinicurvata sediminis TaxID=1121832 RepID=UPI0003B6484A|nr:hypothetical protein [Fodinicurvata sediminis]